MKPLKIAVITAIIVAIVGLLVASGYAIFWNGSSVPAANLANNGGVTNPNNAYTNGTSGNIGGMMGGYPGNIGSMMGDNSEYPSAVQGAVPIQNSVPSISVGLLLLMVAVAAGGTGGLTYFISFTKMKTTQQSVESVISSPTFNTVSPYASVSKTLTIEERKVLDVLVSHEGKYLQKYIRAETGLSRLKTHRILARLAERGIVTLEKTGNTNDVHLSSWLKKSTVLEQGQDDHTKKIEISA